MLIFKSIKDNIKQNNTDTKASHKDQVNLLKAKTTLTYVSIEKKAQKLVGFILLLLFLVFWGFF